MRHSLGLRWWDEFWTDLRYGVRILRKSAGFTAIAVASLALAIGANTTIFSVAKGVLYDRLGVPHPEQLRVLGWNSDEHGAVHSFWSAFNARDVGMKSECFSYPILKQFEEHSQGFDGAFGFKDFNLTAGIRGNAQPVQSEMVSGNFYAVMGVQPQLGRAGGIAV